MAKRIAGRYIIEATYHHPDIPSALRATYGAWSHIEEAEEALAYIHSVVPDEYLRLYYVKRIAKRILRRSYEPGNPAMILHNS